MGVLREYNFYWILNLKCIKGLIKKLDHQNNIIYKKN